MSLHRKCLIFFLGILHGFQRVNANEDRRFRCEQGWTGFENQSCLLVHRNMMNQAASYRYCAEYDARPLTLMSQRKETFILERMKLTSGKFWLAFYKYYGAYSSFVWKTNDGDIRDSEYRNWRGGREDNFYSYSACSYLNVEDGVWDSTTNCSEQHYVICEKKPICNIDLYGAKCDRKCHCHGVTCDPVTGACKYGCRSGYFGETCSRAKEPAKISYRCYNTTSGGSSIHIRVNPMGVKYAKLHLIYDNDDTPVPGCDKTGFTFDEDLGVYSSLINRARCGGKLLSAPNTWQWRVQLQEYEGVMSENDVISVMTCDFDDADTLTQEGKQSLKGDQDVVIKDISETREEVTLAVVDPFTEEVVKETGLGTSVSLRLKLLTAKGLSAVAVSGYSCEAYTSDSTYTRQLTDSEGCSLPGSIMPPMTSNNETALSGIFPIFTFPGYTSINFRCHYEYCFKMEDRCLDRCEYFKRRRRRRSPQEFEDRRSSERITKPVYTTVKINTDKEVLEPGKEEEEEEDVIEDNGRGVPLLYLNPITCSLFLFLLSVFLFHYVFFIKNLKNSVEEMKGELKIQNRHGVALL